MPRRPSSSPSSLTTSSSVSWTSYYQMMSTSLMTRRIAPTSRRSRLLTSQMTFRRAWITCQSRRPSLAWTRCVSFRMFVASEEQWSNRTRSKCCRIRSTISPSSKTGSSNSMSSLGAEETTSLPGTARSQPAVASGQSRLTAQSLQIVALRQLVLIQGPLDGRLVPKRAKNQRIRPLLTSSRFTTSLSTKTSLKR